MPNRSTSNLFDYGTVQSNQQSNQESCQESDQQSGSTIYPKLLVSVRSAHEALEALAGGADIIDVKEPANGPLGPAKIETIQEIAEVVAKQSAAQLSEDAMEVPMTVALGELTSFKPKGPFATHLAALAEIPSIVAVKVGLAGMRNLPWQSKLSELMTHLGTHESSTWELVPVAYADDDAANSPTPEQIFATVNRLGLKGFLIDTYVKSGSQQKPNRGLFGSMSQERLTELFEVIRLMEIVGAIAGSLTLDQIESVNNFQPAIIGVRGAVCEGGREGIVSRDKVQTMRNRISELAIS